MAGSGLEPRRSGSDLHEAWLFAEEVSGSVVTADGKGKSPKLQAGGHSAQGGSEGKG